MDTLYVGTIDLDKLLKERITESERTGHHWAQVSLVILEEPDRFGNEMIIQQRSWQGQPHKIIGNAKLRGRIRFQFPHAVPSKIDCLVETETSERKY